MTDGPKLPDFAVINCAVIVQVGDQLPTLMVMSSIWAFTVSCLRCTASDSMITSPGRLPDYQKSSRPAADLELPIKK